MVASIEADGKTTSCMVTENLNGLMGLNMRETISRIKSKVMVFLLGLTKAFMREDGKKTKCTVKAKFAISNLNGPILIGNVFKKNSKTKLTLETSYLDLKRST